MNKNRFKELLRSTMGDVRPLVSEHVLREAKDDETEYHRYQEGGDPGIEPFLGDPMNERTADELQLGTDVNVDQVQVVPFVLKVP